MTARYEDEVAELHGFFQDWFNGDVEKTDEVFARFADVMAPGFTLRSPDGTTREREPLLEGLFTTHGTRSGMRIWVDQVKLVEETDGVLVVTYEEWHERDGESRGRNSRARMRRAADRPNGLEWLDVHEEWIE